MQNASRKKNAFKIAENHEKLLKIWSLSKKKIYSN